MNPLLISFGCGIAFAAGVYLWLAVASLMTEKGREKLRQDAAETAKRIEDRLSAQVATMIACLEEIKAGRAEREACGARVTFITPMEVVACHCGTTERSPFVVIPHSAIAAVKLLNVKKSQ